MIFSFQNLQTAMGYLAGCYDKIILVNYGEDSWEPIKVNVIEYEKSKNLTLTDWLVRFSEGPDSEDFDVNLLEKAMRYGKPYAANYNKKIDGEYHKVTIEYLPIEERIGYILVFDHNAFKRGRTCTE